MSRYSQFMIPDEQQAGVKVTLTRARSRTLKSFWPALFLLPLLSGSALYALHWGEQALTFHPAKYSQGQAWEIPRAGEEVSFLNRDFLRLQGWFIHSVSQPASATVIFFHGQSG